MDQKATVITLGVRSLEISRRFYVDGLGWKPTLEVPGEVIFIQVAGGLLLGLWSVDEMVREAGSVGHSAKAPPMTISQNVDSPDEVARVFKQALAAGATRISNPAGTDWGGTNAYFADPDGFRWEIAHNAGLRITADGTVHMGPVPE